MRKRKRLRRKHSPTTAATPLKRMPAVLEIPLLQIPPQPPHPLVDQHHHPQEPPPHPILPDLRQSQQVSPSGLRFFWHLPMQ